MKPILSFFIVIAFLLLPLTSASAESTPGEVTIILLPDTQYYTSQYPEMLQAQIDWIVENRAALNIAFVAGLGDITNLGDDAPQEWETAWAALSALENPSATGLAEGIPYGLAVGNHDQTPMDHPEGTTDGYNRYFGVDHFAGRGYYGGHFGNNNDSHYALFGENGLEFLVIFLEDGASHDSSLLEWAGNLLKAHPERLGIVVCHDLLEPQGSFTVQGERVYNGLKENSNLALMLGGHNWAEAHRSDTFNGHTIHTLMADYSNRPRGGNGWLQILTFTAETGLVSVATYSPTLNEWEDDPASRFTLQIDEISTAEPISHIADTTPGVVLNGAQDIVYEQTANTVTEIQSGYLAAMTPGNLDDFIISMMSKHGLPGVAVAVIEGDQVIYLQGYGTAGNGKPLTPQTQMFIGSQSKSFTALAIVQLAEQGKLDLDAPVKTYIPWFRVADETASAKITLRHLLHHTSGLSESGYGMLLPLDASFEDAIHSLASAQLTAPVGMKHQYFNMGYAVLAYIVEITSGESYAEYIHNHIFTPLGMDSSTADPASAANLAQGYSRLFGFAIPMEQQVPRYAIGDGYIVSTPADMARYALAMNTGGAGLVSPEMFKRIFTPGPGNYGFGWYIVDSGAKVFHGGANETFRTEVNLYPARQRAFVLMMNEGYQVDHFISGGQLARGFEALVLGNIPPAVTEGWSVQWIGWGLGIFVLALTALHTRNFLALRGWNERTHSLTTAQKTWDVAISFFIPSVILLLVFWQVSSFYGDRFNLLTNLVYMRQGLPDVFILMLVGSLPDYIQGFIKIFLWRKS